MWLAGWHSRNGNFWQKPPSSAMMFVAVVVNCFVPSRMPGARPNTNHPKHSLTHPNRQPTTTHTLFFARSHFMEMHACMHAPTYLHQTYLHVAAVDSRDDAAWSCPLHARCATIEIAWERETRKPSHLSARLLTLSLTITSHQ